MKKPHFTDWASNQSQNTVPGADTDSLPLSYEQSSDTFTQLPQGMDRLIRDTEGAEIIGGSKATWWRRVADGTLPKPIRIGSMTRWRLSELLAVINALSDAREQPVQVKPGDAVYWTDRKKKTSPEDLLKKEAK